MTKKYVDAITGEPTSLRGNELAQALETKEVITRNTYNKRQNNNQLVDTATGKQTTLIGIELEQAQKRGDVITKCAYYLRQRNNQFVNVATGELTALTGNTLEQAKKRGEVITKGAYYMRQSGSQLVNTATGKQTALTGNELEQAKKRGEVITKTAYYLRQRNSQFVSAATGEQTALTGNELEQAKKRGETITKAAYISRNHDKQLIDSATGQKTTLTGNELEQAKKEKKITTKSAYRMRKTYNQWVDAETGEQTTTLTGVELAQAKKERKIIPKGTYKNSQLVDSETGEQTTLTKTELEQAKKDGIVIPKNAYHRRQYNNQLVDISTGEQTTLSGIELEKAIKNRNVIKKHAYRMRQYNNQLVDIVTGEQTILSGVELEKAIKEKKVIKEGAYRKRIKRKTSGSSEKTISRNQTSTSEISILRNVNENNQDNDTRSLDNVNKIQTPEDLENSLGWEQKNPPASPVFSPRKRVRVNNIDFQFSEIFSKNENLSDEETMEISLSTTSINQAALVTLNNPHALFFNTRFLEKKQDEIKNVLKKEPIEEPSIHPLTVEQIRKAAKILRGQSEANLNCVFYMRDIIKYFQSGIEPTQPSISRPASPDECRFEFVLSNINGYNLHLSRRGKPNPDIITLDKLYLYLQNDTLECMAINRQGNSEIITLTGNNELSPHYQAIKNTLKKSKNSLTSEQVKALFAVTSKQGFTQYTKIKNESSNDNTLITEINGRIVTQVIQADSIITPLSPYNRIPPQSGIEIDISDDAPKEPRNIIDLNRNRHSQQHARYNKIDDVLKKFAIEQDDKVAFGRIGLARVNKYINIGHDIAFYATPEQVIYIDPQLDGDPLFFSMTAKNPITKKPIYDFLAKGKRPNADTFGEECFYMVYPTKEVSLDTNKNINETADESNLINSQYHSIRFI